MSERVWQVVRYGLIAGGSWLAGRGKIQADQVVPMVDDLMQVGGTVVAAGSAVWGCYVKWSTKAVPADVAARPDVPTVSGATGAIVR